MPLSYALHQQDAVEFLKSQGSESVDCIVTDPAYESLEKHRAHGTTTRLMKNWFPIFKNERFPEFFSECYRVLKPNSHLYIYCDDETAYTIKPIGEVAGFKYWKRLVWDKMCVPDDTEALTPFGWKPRSALRAGDVIAAVTRPKMHIVWQPIEQLNVYPVVDESMVHVKTTKVDMLLTGSHRIFIRGLGPMRADALLSMPKRRWLVPVGGEAHIQGKNGKIKNGAIAKSELIGWYVAEGTPMPKSGAMIYQSKQAGRARIRELIQELGLTYSEFDDRFYIYKSSAAFLLDYGKKIKRESLGLPKLEMRAFFNGLVGGDGTFYPSGLVHFWQKDKDQIELFQEIAIRLGYACNVRQCKPNLWIASCRMSHWTGFTPKNVTSELYTGTVWCPTVKAGYWLARRNGKPFVTGNSIGMGYHYRSRCEYILFFEKGKRRLNNLGMPDVFDLKEDPEGYVIEQQRIMRGFPTEKPVSVSEKLILQSTVEGDVVLDTFMGSGSVGVAALRNNRSFVGVDIEEGAVSLVSKRLEDEIASWQNVEQLKLDI